MQVLKLRWDSEAMKEVDIESDALGPNSVSLDMGVAVGE